MTKTTFVENVPAGELVGDTGSYEVVLLTPGLGASAYYSEELVRRDAPTAFPKGTHVYLGHSPVGVEPSPDKLLGTLIQETAIRESDGAAINRFEPIPRHAELVAQVRKHVGLSINAQGTATRGIVEGRDVKIAESIEYHRTNSVDMVSYAGREGSGFVESLFASTFGESVQPEPSATGSQEEGIKMIDAETKEYFDSRFAILESLVKPAPPAQKADDDFDAEADRASAVEAVRAVESAEVSASVKSRLIEGIKRGEYDVTTAITEAVAEREALKAELKESGYVVVGANGTDGDNGPVTVKGWTS